MNTIIIPAQFEATQNKKIKVISNEIEELSLADISVKIGSEDIRFKESDLEEFVRINIQDIFSQETLLVVGQQVTNREGGRSDLVALDDSGNIVLIELKRDANDMAVRREALEFQAIRYAANYALIHTPQELVQKIFAPYIEKHRDEYNKRMELTASQLALEILETFLEENKIKPLDFNQQQRIVLIASSFDAQTLSACAWLSKNNIDLRCLSINLIKYEKKYFFIIEQTIPPQKNLDDFFVEVARPSGKGLQHRTNLPKMPKLFEWNLIKVNDEIYIPIEPDETATVVNHKSVKYQGKIISFNDWGRKVTGWSAINIYEWTYLKSSNKSLDYLRRAEMEKIADQTANSDEIMANQTAI